MGINIEIKAKAHNIEKQHELAAKISDKPVQIIEQVDTFFNVSNGRLKLRELASNQVELIHYWREDKKGPRESKYSIFHSDNPNDLKDILATALGIQGIVHKKRSVYLAGQTRIHIDNVENLGWFLELEVVLTEKQSSEEGKRIAYDLMRKLDIRDEDLIDCAYIDLIDSH